MHLVYSTGSQIEVEYKALTPGVHAVNFKGQLGLKRSSAWKPDERNLFYAIMFDMNLDVLSLNAVL